MHIDVAPSHVVLSSFDLSDRRVVVIDAVRASSTIAAAIANGARRVIPTVSVEEAVARRASYLPEHALLGGERNGVGPPGFDLGNSPPEYRAEAVRGKTIILATTNGAPAVLACRTAHEVLVGAFVNLPAVVNALAQQEGNVLLVAVGCDGAPVLDDIVCAGMYVDRLQSLVAEAALSDTARLAWFAYQGYRERILDALRNSPSGRDLIEIGLESDLAYCAQVGVCSSVPRFANGEIR